MKFTTSVLVVLSAVALGAQATAPKQAAPQQPPAPSPTGYKDTADAWVNTGALVARMNFALDLAAGTGDIAFGLAANGARVAAQGQHQQAGRDRDPDCE